MKLRKSLVAAGVAAAGVVAAVAGPAAPAMADGWVVGCTGVLGGTCVQATMGSKDYTNHTQWVGWVEARSWGNTAGIVKLEAWGDGFYFSSSVNPNDVNPERTWGAQRWVHSGTYVCGAATDQEGYRDIACIAVRV